MGTTDGAIVGATKILDHGSDADRWTVVLVAEGYQAAQLTQFHTDAQNFVNTLVATAPFDSLQAAINVYRLDVSSTDSGADDPIACAGSGATPATYFDATFCGSGIHRLLLVNNANVINAVNANVAAWNMIMVLVNSPIYGGSGGAVATFSMAAGANEIGLHEMGHTAFGLADEYESLAGCGAEVGHDNYPGAEPAQPDITINTNRATIKWGDLILATTPLPTTSNPNCANCDTQANPYSADTVGAYEGAAHYHCGIYRPQYDCRMRALGFPFCAVCRRRIVQTLSPHLPAKLVLKEILDSKAKLEKLEYKEIKFEKAEKHEKLELFEKGHFKEHKPQKLEVEGKRPFEGPKLKDAELGQDPRSLIERVERLESAVTGMRHFITPEQRPDLGRGALAAEPKRARGSVSSRRRSKR